MSEAQVRLDNSGALPRAEQSGGVDSRGEPLHSNTGITEVPRHLAIIMDGNHRWAKARHLPGAAGHRAGARNVRPVAEAYLLMDLMRGLLDDDIDELNERGVQLRIIGDRSRFAPDLRRKMQEAEALTRENNRMRLNIAVNYGGRWDIAEAARAVAEDVKAGLLTPAEIDEGIFQRYLSSDPSGGHLPDHLFKYF